MSKAKKKDGPGQAKGTVVYVGPTIPGLARQYTSFVGGVLTNPLGEIVARDTLMAGLVVPLDQLPETMKRLNGRYGHIYRLYRVAQDKYKNFKREV